MLFIGDDQAEIGKENVRLDECVRTDENLDRTGIKLCQEGFTFLFARPARKQGNAHGQIVKEAAKLFIMLDGQDFRRCHKGTLVAVFYDLCQGQGGYNRFPGAYVALDEALHRHFPFHVVLYVQKGCRLASRELKGQLGKELAQEAAIGTALNPLAAAFLAPPQEEPHLHIK